MNLDYFKEHKFISAILIVLIICVCRMCMYQRVIRNGQVYIINKITNTYYIQGNSHSSSYVHWWQRPIALYKKKKAINEAQLERENYYKWYNNLTPEQKKAEDDKITNELRSHSLGEVEDY